jgi:hypothetical protein
VGLIGSADAARSRPGWPVPAGVRRLKVEAILYQPERAGEYDA